MAWFLACIFLKFMVNYFWPKKGEGFKMQINAIRTEILNEIIDYCIEKRFRPVLVIPPVSATMHEEIRKYNLNLKWMVYNQLTKDVLDKAPLFDYFLTQEFDDDSYYINADFLNKEGRNRFTEKLINDVADTLY